MGNCLEQVDKQGDPVEILWGAIPRHGLVEGRLLMDLWMLRLGEALEPCGAGEEEGRQGFRFP